MNRRPCTGYLVACLLIAFGVLTRVMPHPPNFTAVAAMAMFASFYLGSWTVGAAVPIITLVLSDLVKGAYEPRLMAAVYLSSLFPVLCGSILRGRLKAGWVVSLALCSSVTFFITTNFAVWLFSTWYSHDWAGLLACYTAAVPFIRYTLMSDLLFSSSIFGAYAFALHWRASVARPARTWLPIDSSSGCASIG
jgi:hypothetical protein